MQRFKIIFLVVVIILFLGSLAAYVFIFSPLKVSDEQKIEMLQAPKIVVEPNSYDFGTVVYGDKVSHEFIVRNDGGEPLTILRLSTSCGCTKAEMREEDKTIASGQVVPLQVSFDPAVHKDDSDLGDIVRVVYIQTNDPEKPELEVNITANVIKEGEESVTKEPVASQDTADNSQVKNFRIAARQWMFFPSTITVKEGDRVRLELVSYDVNHGFTVPELNINSVLRPGETSQVEFVAERKGSYPFVCSVYCGAGHGSMKGQIIVE